MFVKRLLQTTAALRQTATQPAKPLPNELLHLIQQHIRAHGPMPLPRYMHLCLSHPTLGYYARMRDQSGSSILGARGDFITSPEISQVFGELLAIWFISQWQAQGAVPKTRIVELGPGKGTLMSDMLRTFDRIKPFAKTLDRVDLVETSSYLRQVQAKALAKHSIKPHWADTIDALQARPDEFIMIVAHEFFDALPICMVERRTEGWREVLVDEVAATGIVSSTPQAKLRLVASRAATAMSLLYSQRKELAGLSVGTRVETSPDAFAIASKMGKLVSGAKAGAALIIDYGDARQFGNSFRGFQQHRITDPMMHPGETDLTANVDFSWLREAIGDDAVALGPETQRRFLQHMGLEVRVKQLLDAASPIRQSEITKGTDRLIDVTGMGQQYKFMGVLPRGSAADAFPFDLP